MTDSSNYMSFVSIFAFVAAVSSVVGHNNDNLRHNRWSLVSNSFLTAAIGTSLSYLAKKVLNNRNKDVDLNCTEEVSKVSEACDISPASSTSSSPTDSTDNTSQTNRDQSVESNIPSQDCPLPVDNSEKESSNKKNDGEKKKVRVWIDGCYDLMHFGHANAFRQARALGDELVVGVNMDKDIVVYKGGPPTMNDEERLAAVAGCKFVDEVVPDVPYMMTEDFLHHIFDHYNIDFVVHGDDPCLTPDGKDVYGPAKALGRYIGIKRTEGVSTTDLVGRMLKLGDTSTSLPDGPVDVSDSTHEGFIRGSSFLPSARRITQFADFKAPKDSDIVMYVAGSFDLFHPGHIAFLKACRSRCDYLVVGVHSDHVVNKRKGSNFPVMSANERALSVMSCKYVDDVIIGAPWVVTKDLLLTYNVSKVLHGFEGQDGEDVVSDVAALNLRPGLEDPYVHVRAMGKLEAVNSGSSLNATQIIDRIMVDREVYEAKFARKNAAELAYYQNDKVYVAEM